MTLPIRTTVEDIEQVCGYLIKKPTGSTIRDAKAVLEAIHLDGRKLSAMKFWSLIEGEGDKLKVTPHGRLLMKSEESKVVACQDIVRRIQPYNAIVERACHRKEDSLTSAEVAAHWHEHFKDEVGKSDKILNDQAVCFFQIASAAKLGTMITGRHGQATRFSFTADAVSKFCDVEASDSSPHNEPRPQAEAVHEEAEKANGEPKSLAPESPQLGQAIFIAHGKNKKPLEQLKRVLDQFKIPYRTAIDEPNLGRPISAKVREIMKSCNCAILIFTGDEEFKDSAGNTVWRPSQNVVHELGAAAFLYDNRIVILKENRVTFASNYRDIGYIDFETDQLETKMMDLLRELVGFGIVRFST